MLHPDLEVRPSPISGRGLFARRAIAAGTVLWAFRPETSRPFDPARDADEHPFEDPAGRRWVCTDGARFWNHSCEPNAAPCGDRDVALRDLVAGEEATYDYGLILPAGAPPLDCRCGRRSCRGRIARLPPDHALVHVLRERAEAAVRRAPSSPAPGNRGTAGAS